MKMIPIPMAAAAALTPIPTFAPVDIPVTDVLVRDWGIGVGVDVLV